MLYRGPICNPKHLKKTTKAYMLQLLQARRQDPETRSAGSVSKKFSVGRILSSGGFLSLCDLARLGLGWRPKSPSPICWKLGF